MKATAMNAYPWKDYRASLYDVLTRCWIQFWMRRAGLGPLGRIATRLASSLAPPHKARTYLAGLSLKGYIHPDASIYHGGLRLGTNVFIGDRVIIFQAALGGSVEIGDRVCLLRDTIIETGNGGSLTIGADTYIHPRCQLNAYEAPIRIGCGVLIAANCAFYPHDHGIAPDRPIREQPLESRGGIVVGDHAWLGTGVIVLGGVRIGSGAVIGAGAVVTRDVPDSAVAVGVPARVVKFRSNVAELVTQTPGRNSEER